MTLLFVVGLVSVASSPLILRWRYGSEWLFRPFTLLILTACVYHGVSEVLIRLTNASSLVVYRPSDEFADRGMIAAGLALLALTIGYVAFSPPKVINTRVDISDLARRIDWRFTAVLLIPLFAATTQGKGYNNGVALDAAAGESVTGLAYQFFFTATILTGFGLLLRYRSQFVLIVAGQSIALAIAGQRLEVVLGAVLLWFLGRRVGLTPTRRQLIAVGIAGLLVVGAIGSVRASVGRQLFYSDNGLSARLDALKEGVLHPNTDSVNGGDTVAEAALRLDSNTWSGQVTEEFAHGKQPLGDEVLKNTVLSAVPSVLYPNKLQDLSVYDRSPKVYATVRLGMPRIDYLTGHAMFFYPALGLYGLLLFNLVVGAVFGRLEKWSLNGTGLARFVALVLLAQSALFFERGLEYYLIVGRAYLVILAALVVWTFAKRLFGGSAQTSDVLQSRRVVGAPSRATSAP